MKFIFGTPRNQPVLLPLSLEEQIGDAALIRNIDTFVNALDTESLGFKENYVNNGRPAYHPKVLLKIFIYGYLNSIRSSRKLERQCHINIEMKWLTEELAPDHNTISKFRKENPDAIKAVFQSTVSLAQNFNLIGGTLIAGDSTKFRAQNSKKNNFNAKKIKRHLNYIENKLSEYQTILEQEDESVASKKKAEAEIEKHSIHKKKYEQLSEALLESGDTQISTSDPESRHLIIRGSLTEVAYNTQVTTDAEHCIPIDYQVTNENDKKAMGPMLESSQIILKPEAGALTALFDKGYHTGSELNIAAALEINTLVAIPGKSNHAQDERYDIEKFDYDEQSDTYQCPQGHKLSSNGSWYKTRNYEFKQYKTNNCKTCPVRSLCTTAKKSGRVLQRSEHQKYVEENAKRVAAAPEIYKRRQAIVEHPFGTIKRQWGFDHIMTKKGMKRASADVGLMFIAYNLRRIWNILNEQSINYRNSKHIIYLVLVKLKTRHLKQLKKTENHKSVAQYNKKYWLRAA